MKMVYMCHGGFNNRGLREHPLTENGELSELPTREKTVLELNITKKHIYF